MKANAWILALALPSLVACAVTAASVSNGASSTDSSGRYPLIHGKVAIYIDSAPRQIAADGRSFIVGLTLVNGLGHAFDIPDACNGWLPVGLESPTVGFRAVTGGVACASLSIAPGITHATRSVITTYPGCSEGPAVPGAELPQCTGPDHRQVPPLPQIGRAHV